MYAEKRKCFLTWKTAVAIDKVSNENFVSVKEIILLSLGYVSVVQTLFFNQNNS